MPDSSPRWRRNIAFTVLADVIVLLAVLLAFEVYARWDHRWLHTSLHMPTADVEILVACFGDSHTYGMGASEGESYPEQLERLLAGEFADIDVQVVNEGEPGANSSLALQTVRRFLWKSRVTPDVLIYSAGRNNVWNIQHSPILPGHVAVRRSAEWYKHLLQDTYAYRLSKVTLTRLQQFTAGGTQFPKVVFSPKSRDERKLLRDWLRHDLDELHAICRSREIDLVLMNYWEPHPWIDAEMFEFAAATDNTFIDIFNFGDSHRHIRRCPSDFVARDCHPSGKGYARIARLVFETLAPMLAPTDAPS
ncbi:hypothetical protein K8I61_14105 [bacterium]|nr:hypothetical protein [bacterium]